MYAKITEVKFQGIISKFRIVRSEMKFRCCLFMLTIKCKIRHFHTKLAKKCTKEHDTRKKVVVLLIKPFVSLMLSSPSCCWICKSLMFPAKKEEVMLFDVGITWTPMLNGKANGCSQWFLSICIIATSLEKSLVAGHRCNKHVQWNPHNTNLDNSNSPLTQTKSYFPCISLHFSVIFTWLTQTRRAGIPH